MAKKIWVSLLLFSVASSAFAQPYYSNTIKADTKTYALVKDALDDLKLQLNKATGKDFSIDTKDSTRQTGIQIIKLDPLLIYKSIAGLDPDNDDAVLIQSDGDHSLSISAYTRQGLINGIYTYLDTLGFRWYHPGDAWAYVPVLKDIRIKCNQVFVPDFALRTFFGTWGTPRNKVVDKNGVVDNAWQVWATRNRMGGGYVLKGHMWNEFLWHNIKLLEQHPEYMALVDGKRVIPNTAMKFCISNKDLQQLFVHDMVEKLNKAITANPNQTLYCFSVEPSDGEGDCECDQCKKMGSVSNRVFFLANLVAKEFQKISPKAYVNLYAYNFHAAPPDFAIEKNVLVQIIPYGYQNFSSPEQMIAAWKKKSSRLFIYDYYGLPINNIDMPLKDGLKPEAFAKRIKYWYDEHIIGVTLESSYSIGATGIGLYLFTRLGWHVNSDVNAILDDYYKHCYGKAGDYVRQAQRVISNDTADKICALSQAMQLIEKHASKTKLEGQQKTCLTYYKAYLHYLRLLYDVQREDPKIEPAASESLMQFVYGIMQTMMVHQFPVNEWAKSHGPAADYVKQHWDGFKPFDAGMKFSTVVPWTEEQMDAAFEEDCKLLPK